MKKLLFRLIIFVVILCVLLFTYRLVFCPRLVIAHGVSLSPESVEVLEEKLNGRILTNDRLAAEIASKKVVLVGETHFQPRIMAYFTNFLEHIPGKKLVINLEMPGSMQGAIDQYMATGDEHAFEAIRNCADCLPYSKVIKWCREHHDKVEGVFAVDENKSRIFLMRCVCQDTRNQTMARHIKRAADAYPDKLTIFYGGQLHCLLGGRYLYDAENRTPAGKLLLENGINKADICTILLDYDDHFPASAAWNGRIGAAPMADSLGNLPVNYFVGDTIFGEARSGTLFDYYVNVGKITSD